MHIQNKTTYVNYKKEGEPFGGDFFSVFKTNYHRTCCHCIDSHLCIFIDEKW